MKMRNVDDCMQKVHASSLDGYQSRIVYRGFTCEESFVACIAVQSLHIVMICELLDTRDSCGQ